MTLENQQELLKAELARLTEEHRDLDVEIKGVETQPHIDRLGLQRMKKRKLLLKDRIAVVEDLLTPDIIA